MLRLSRCEMEGDGKEQDPEEIARLCVLLVRDRAFLNCETLTAVEITIRCSELGRALFASCGSLETAVLPEGLQALPGSIFCDCSSLKSVRLPSSLKEIGEWAFCDCSALRDINSAALRGVESIGKLAFFMCSSLEEFTLPPLLKTLELATFEGCQR